MTAFTCFIVLALALSVVILSVRLFLVNRDLRAIRSDLERFDEDNYGKNISIASGNKGVEELAAVINKKILSFKEAVIHYRNMEDELRQAIANMGHDLRTPLTSVSGYLQLLKKEVTTEEGLQYMEVMERRAKTLETMINGFFELSMIEAPVYPLSIEAVDLTAVLAQQMAERVKRFQNGGITPELDIPDQAVKVFADFHALDRIIANLLGNVLQHARGRVLIRLHKVGKSAVLEISNSAENLSSEDVGKLFDRFYTADKVRNGANNGLGLPIVKALAEKMGGSVTAGYADSILTIRLTLRANVYEHVD